MARSLDDQMVRWPDDQMAGWPEDQMARSPDDRMARRPYDQKSRWHIKQILKNGVANATPATPLTSSMVQVVRLDLISGH